MKITILGSGTAAPRVKRNMAGYLLEVDNKEIEEESIDRLEDVDAFWSGFISKSKNVKIGVDMKFF